ncbi:MAG: MG2 domain-containing protein [Bacteroidales bacterium]
MKAQDIQPVPYSQLWSKVEQANKDGLPQTAVQYLKEIEQKAKQDGNILEQLYASEEIYTALTKYNWKEANQFNPTLSTLRNEIYADLDSNIEKYADNPRVIMLLYKRLINHKSQVDSKLNPLGADYLGIREEALALKQKYASTEYAQKIQRVVDGMDGQTLSFSDNGQTMPRKGIEYIVSCKNVSVLKVDIYRLKDNYTYSQTGDLEENLPDFAKYGEKYASLTFDDFKNEYNITEKQGIKVDLEREGVYLLYFNAGKAKNVTTINVSRVAVGVRTVRRETEFYAADITTGEPFAKPRVSIFRDRDVSSKNGFVPWRALSTTSYKSDGFNKIKKLTIPSDANKNSYKFRVENGSDRYSPLMYLKDGTGSSRKSESMNDYVRIYTDRELYKPTDTVYFKVICCKTDGVRGEVVPNKSVEIKLRHESSNEAIATVKLVTNDMGSASGFFTIPEGSRNGTYILADKRYNSRFIRVETYKRPTFAVNMIPVKDVYCFTDVVKQQGKVTSYAGFSVANAVIEYDIQAYARVYPWGSTTFEDKRMSGKILSDNDGGFEINFVAERPKSKNGEDLSKSNITVTYRITVKATDPQGETHEVRSSVIVSDTPIDLNISFDMDAEDIEDGELDDYDEIDDQGRVLVDKDITDNFAIAASSRSGFPVDVDGSYVIRRGETDCAAGSYKSNSPISFDFKSLLSGEYEFVANIEYRGKKIETKRKFVLLSPGDTKVPYESEYFYYPLKTVDGIEFLIGTSEEDLYLELELFDADHRLYRQPVHLRDEMVKIVLPYEKSYPSMVVLSLFGFRNGKEINHHYDYIRPNDIRFDIDVETFRDKTTPRSQERFTVKAPASELMVSIFDVTTDRFDANSFYFQPLSSVIRTDSPDITTTLNQYSWRGPRFRAYSVNTSLMGMVPGVAVEESAADDMLLKEEVVAAKSVQDNDDAGGEEETSVDVVPRSNFGELLAFYPHIRVGEDGKAEVTFTTNDNLSTYRVLIMGYNQELKSAQVERSLIVQKEAMMVPNIPLFVREGDMITLKSKVVNLGVRELHGIAHIEFYDAVSGKSISLDGCDDIKLTLPAQAQGEVAWSVAVPSAVEKLGVKMTYSADGVSDGERHEIIVEPALITLTEAASFILGGSHGRKYYEKQLQQRIGAVNPIIEYAEYSTLSAVKESLPMAKKPSSDNAIAWISAFYINQMRGKVLGDASPAGEAAIREAFRDEAVAKMRTLQNTDGGFKWFSGMNSSDMITLFFLDKMDQLRSVGAIEFTADEDKLIVNALHYIDNRLATTKELSFNMVQYFAVRSEYLDVALSDGATAAFKSYLSKTVDGWQNIPILSKALLCETLLNCKGKEYWDKSFTERVDKLTRSLKDYAVQNNTVGCYFPNAVMPLRGLMNSEIYAHAQLIDLFGRIGERKMVNGLAQWLLLQKHNQAWENTVATTDAVYALISSNAKDLKLGAVYYTYTTTLDKVEASGNEITVQREFLRASDGKAIADGDALSVGDKIIVRYKVYNTENRSFVQMCAMRPACFYPENEASGYTWWGRYYKEVRESATNYYFELLPEEYTTIEERFYVTQAGTFTSSLVQIESLYAREYRGHTASVKIVTK